MSEKDMQRLSDDLGVRQVALSAMIIIAAQLLAESAGISIDEAKDRIIKSTIARMREGS